MYVGGPGFVRRFGGFRILGFLGFIISIRFGVLGRFIILISSGLFRILRLTAS